ncbi:MAG: hypothetical protein AAF328_10345 [Planctomycetota bacterium]
MFEDSRRFSVAWMKARADRFRFAWFGFSIAAFAATCSLVWRPGNDSAELLVIARRLNDTGQFRTLGGYHEGVMPGYPWLLAGLGRVGDAATLAMVLNVFAFAMWVALVFLWVRARFDRATAVVVATMCAWSARSMEAAADVLPGMLFAVLLAALLLWEAKPRGWALRVVGVGLLLSAMMTLRSVGLLVAAAWLVSLAWRWLADKQRSQNQESVVVRIAALVAGFGVLAGCFALIPAFRQDVAAVWNDWTTHGLSGIAATSWEAVISGIPEAILGIDPTPYGGVVLTAAAGLGVFLLLRRDVWCGLLVIALALPWFLFLTTPRYVVPVLPLLYLGLWLVLCEAHRRWSSQRVWIAGAFALVLVGNVIGVGRLVYEQRQPAFLETYRDGRYVACRSAGDWLSRHTTRGTRVICTTREKAVLSYWSGRAVLDTLSTPAVNAGRLLSIEPADPAFRGAMDTMGWSLSVPLATFAAPQDEQTWTLHEVIRP